MKYLIVLILLLSQEYGSAYPIDPITLNEMISCSPYVAYGKVINSYDTIAKEDSNSLQTYATVKIEKMVVGYIEEETIKIFYDAHMICPSPARFKQGALVTVFFKKKDQEYRTTGLSYSTTYHNNESRLDTYHRRIMDNARIRDLSIGEERERKLTNWCIDNLDYQIVRNDAVRELSRAFNNMNKDIDKKGYRPYGKKRPSINLVNYMTDNHKVKIKSYLYNNKIKVFNLKGLEYLFTKEETNLKKYLIMILTDDIKRNRIYRIKSYLQKTHNNNLPKEAIEIYNMLNAAKNIFYLDKDLVIEKTKRYLELIE